MKMRVLTAILAMTLVVSACISSPTPIPTETPAAPVVETTAPALLLSSTAFSDGGAIPAKHTCQEENISPELIWGTPPGGTQSFALVMKDIDVSPSGFLHWIIYHIPSSSQGLAQAIPNIPELPDSSRQLKNGAGRLGYTGPCPPNGTHHYVFTLYALDTVPDLAAEADEAALLDAMQGHILAQAALTGTYSK
jgi:Raf kinase inhibitor-like YbhB/YbcL family protein